MATYDALGLVDASVVAVAERLKLHAIATTDRRDFSVVRPAHVERFTLVP
jgi:predicted nucleic acid-binding protein